MVKQVKYVLVFFMVLASALLARAETPVPNVAGYPCEALSKPGLAIWIRGMLAGEDAGMLGARTSGQIPGWYAQELYSESVLGAGQVPHPDVMGSFGQRTLVPAGQVGRAIQLGSGLSTFGLGVILSFAMDYADANNPNDLSCNAKGMIYSSFPTKEKPKGQCTPRGPAFRESLRAGTDSDGDGICDDETV